MKTPDEKFMFRALELAEKGVGMVSPNPMVGAVIVKDGEIIGEGYHEKYGNPHAERNAITNARQDLLNGSTIFVTLEPCSHHGKTPPCTDAIIAAGVKRVVIAAKDPNPKVSGGGANILKAAGIDVETGLLEKEAIAQNAPYFKWVKTGMPYIIAKWAMTLDGKTASRSGDSKWISNEQSRKYVHYLRGRYDSIMVGSGTVIADNPMLTCRGFDLPSPKRIIVDSKAGISPDSYLVKSANEFQTIIATTKAAGTDKLKNLKKNGCKIIDCPDIEGRVDINHLFKELGKRDIQSVLVEGGATLFGSLFDAGLPDKAIVFISPKIAGGQDALTPVAGIGIDTIKDSIGISEWQVRHFDGDIMIEGEIQRKD